MARVWPLQSPYKLGRGAWDCKRGRRRAPGQGVRWEGSEGKETFKKREAEIGKHGGEGRH